MSPFVGSAASAPTVLSPVATGAVQPVLAAARPTAPATSRPVLPIERVTMVRPASEDAPGSDARRTLAAAVRKAAMNAAGPSSAESGDAQPATVRPVPLPPSELIARVTARAALPVLPEPASPAREAFAEAIIALRSGIRLDGTTTA
jgi:hypothetical protein